jgi:hypothetical protein
MIVSAEIHEVTNKGNRKLHVYLQCETRELSCCDRVLVSYGQ